MERLWSLIGQFGDLAAREATALELAECLGAQRLVVFLRDPELHIPLPAPGFPQTLDGAWMDLVKRCQTGVELKGELILEQRSWEAHIFGRRDIWIVLLGGTPDRRRLEKLFTLLPLLEALLRNEMLAQRAEENAAAAEQAASEAADLTLRLDASRRQLQVHSRELSEAKTAADAANRAKSDFLANMSHEIRTPMAAILGFVDILQRQIKDPDNLECLSVIYRNGHHLLEIINDILDLSKIESGSLELESIPVQIGPLVAEVVELMRERANIKGLQLEVSYETLVPETIQSDPTRLRQVLLNLLGNAVKFTESGSVQVVGRLLREDQLLEFSVIDTGIGINPEVIPLLFRAFHQADTSVTRRFGGTGLGLTITKQMVQLLGGSLSVESEIGKGSCFKFTVTTGALEGVELVQPRLSWESEGAGCQNVPDLTGCRLLVADDRRDIRDLVVSYLEAAGAHVSTAKNGQEALDVLSDHPVDVVLLDMQMPILDGYATARKLREQGCTLPILALTASAMRGDRDQCMEAGCNGYLTKPIDRVTLIRQTWALVHLSRTLRVLIVEDNPFAATAVKGMLDSLGCDSSIAGSGEAALNSVAQEPPDIILLDLGLPDMDGGELLTLMRSLPALQETRVIALTGRRADEVKEFPGGVRFDAIVEKPASRETLRRHLFL